MKTKIFGVLLLISVMTVPAFAAYDMYLQIEGVAGSASDSTHKDWIPVSEIVDNTIKTGNVATLVMVKPIEGSSALLYKDCLLGSSRPKAILDVCRDGAPLYRITMNVLKITQIKPELTKEDPYPREEISFGFKSITWEFYMVGADGKPATTRTGWDNEMKRVL